MVIGLTGGAASGKSLVSGEFRRLGAEVVDADMIAREILDPGQSAYGDVVKEFGGGILKEDGSVDRKALGRIVFSDREKLAILNRITHPRIMEIIRERIVEIKGRGGENPLIVVDAALLIEVGLNTEMDGIVVVYAGEEARIERMMKRDGLTRAEALLRIKAQMPLDEKRAYADYVIDNSGSPDETVVKVRSLYRELTGGGSGG